ncbi:MAG: hypothetical protein FPO08_16710 [Geobacter sp.]|nr:MAG: hypothetical protein FPO08_16710 [Geobacter sp.]
MAVREDRCLDGVGVLVLVLSQLPIHPVFFLLSHPVEVGFGVIHGAPVDGLAGLRVDGPVPGDAVLVGLPQGSHDQGVELLTLMQGKPLVLHVRLGCCQEGVGDHGPYPGGRYEVGVHAVPEV